VENYIEASSRNNSISGAGSFISVPDAFVDADSSVRNLVKLEFRHVFSEDSRVQSLFSTDVALIDLRAIKPENIKPEVIRRDCELLSGIVEKYPDSAERLISALLDGTQEGVDSAISLAEEIGLTEAQFVKKGGGLFFLVAIAAGALLAGGCATVGSNKPLKASTTPKPSGTSDAGPPDDAGGRIPK
jgi:hypothetical protein